MQHGSTRIQKQEALPNAISGPDFSNWTALHEAVVAADDRRLEVLLSTNADRMAKESSLGNTPLHEAASRGFSRCVKLICAPPPTAKVQPKEKSRLKARVANTIEAQLGVVNHEGLSALHLAAQNGHNQSSRELLMSGADPDVQNNYGDTPLHTACRYGHAGVTRILLSALCDPNKTNLNGDTALHITCAMGRRKLTRILLEADARLGIKNAQGDCPMHIAIRKNYREIIEILNTPKKIRNRKEKHKAGSRSDKDRDRDVVDKGINWSPYGCHYFPDPRAFSSPNLETLPKDPLKPGEQYFLDLAGHIHKGPVSVGNTCYCGPFFRHIENKLNCNRKSLKKYVNKTKERLGHKVQALAIKTNDQIEQLTRTMIEDRLRCENKRQHLNEFLRRGEPMRSTSDNQNKSSRIERKISRCGSLELLELEKNYETCRLTNSRSVDVLEDQAVEAIVHQSPEVELDSDTDDDSDAAREDAAVDLARCRAEAKQTEKVEHLEHSKLDELKLDFLKVSERLGVLLEKTTLIMERDSEQESKHQLSSPSPGADSARLQEDKESVNSPNFDEYTHVLRRYPNSSETSNPSQNSNSWDWQASPTGSHPPPGDYHKYYHRIGRGENMLNSVIKALSKDASFAELSKEEAAVNESADRICGDKLLYKEQACEVAALGQPHSSSQRGVSNLTKRQPLCLEDSFPTIPNMFYSNPIMEYAEDAAIRQNGSETVNKVEIRNSEIKCLKKPNVGQIRGTEAQLQSTIDSNQQQGQEQDSHPATLMASRSPSHLNNNFKHIEAASLNPSPTYSIPHRIVPQFGLPDRHIPKDTYFHELPHRPQPPPPQPQPQHRRISSGYVPNGNFYRNEELYAGKVLTSPQSNISMSGEYINRATYRPLQSPHSQGLATPNLSIHPIAWQNRLPPDDIDVEELSAIGLYNNVSSLV
ncbi:uncharacterized protein LOC117192898 [Drosophila miranda]|uniref:uncharacterized protein LOC117192898 n=1 Tax=Drosophila miranda TaxID=7229 RepID=UPI00143FAA3C|nr:uncharacterized protein LOC117192898 [Drosophila miranda]